MRNIFGWSYPPGCSGPPEDDSWCEVCGKEAGDCICPECVVCGDAGNPSCYKDHGLEASEEQRQSLESTNAAREAEVKAESDYYAQIGEEEF